LIVFDALFVGTQTDNDSSIPVCYY